MEPIIFDKPEAFVPDTSHVRILQAVAGKPGCPIRHVVQQLQPDFSESRIRSGVRNLLAKKYLDGGKSSTEAIVLRLTSNGRVLLDKVTAV
jgi:hypothetical protein